MSIPLAALEDIIDGSGVAPRIEALLPAGVRRRQLTIRTLLLGMQLTLADHRPAHLTGVRAGADRAARRRPGAARRHRGLEERPAPAHLPPGRAHLRPHGGGAGKEHPDGAPSAGLAAVCDDLLEASIPARHKNASAALSADWTDMETWSRPPRHGTTGCADPEASWGHRNSNLPGPKGEMFFGYYLSAATMAPTRHGPAVPELARRMTLSCCDLDPARALVPVLARMPAAGIPLGDILADSGYAHRNAGAWAIPLRQRRRPAHPGPPPARPRPPRHPPRRDHRQRQPLLPRDTRATAGTGPAAPRRHRRRHRHARTRAGELARHKLGRLTADDADGYHRVICPAAMGKLRCPLRPASMTLAGTGPRSSPRRSTRQPAAPSRPSPSRPDSQPRPARNTTTPPPRTGAPTPAAPPPNGLLHHQGPGHHHHHPRLVPPDRA